MLSDIPAWEREEGRINILTKNVSHFVLFVCFPCGPVETDSNCQFLEGIGLSRWCLGRASAQR